MRTYRLASFDGTALAVHEAGDKDARPVVLLHGLFSSAQVNWIKYGHAATIAQAGFRVIMPDFRVHGESPAPHDPASYPPDVLVRDTKAIIAALGLDDFDLGGFSLGARTTAALLADGVRPRRAILAGMGWEGLSGWAERRRFFLDAIAQSEGITRDNPHFMAVMFMRTMKIDREAAQLLLQSPSQIDLDALVEVKTPMAVICGDEDHDNGSAPALAKRLAHARYIEVPGTHMSCIARPEMGQAIASFLA